MTEVLTHGPECILPMLCIDVLDNIGGFIQPLDVACISFNAQTRHRAFTASPDQIDVCLAVLQDIALGDAHIDSIQKLTDPTTIRAGIVLIECVLLRHAVQYKLRVWRDHR